MARLRFKRVLARGLRGARGRRLHGNGRGCLVGVTRKVAGQFAFGLTAPVGFAGGGSHRQGCGRGVGILARLRFNLVSAARPSGLRVALALTETAALEAARSEARLRLSVAQSAAPFLVLAAAAACSCSEEAAALGFCARPSLRRGQFLSAVFAAGGAGLQAHGRLGRAGIGRRA